MTPRPIRTRSSPPSTIPPATSQRRDTRWNRMRFVYNNCGCGLFLLTGQAEDVPVILRIRADEEQPISGLDCRLGVEYALAVGAGHRDRQLDALLGAIPEHEGGRALGELDRLGLALGE